MDCVFCGALERERERVVYQDSHVFVVVNIEPLRQGHVMVLPIRHAEQLRDLTPEEAHAFLQAVDRCIQAFNAASDEHALCVVNSGKYRSQPHLHAHVLPSQNSLRGLFVASYGVPERQRADAATLRAMADAVRNLLCR